jgi:hypothetical protein
MKAYVLAYDRYVDLLDPTPEDFLAIGIKRIAHTLSARVRFCALCDVWITVAEHCVRCSRIVSPRAALHALWHEGDEVLLPDFPGPLKITPAFDAMRPILKRHERAFSLAFGLGWPWPQDIADEVKVADLVMLSTEARDIMRADTTRPEWGTMPPADAEIIEPWCAERAEREFVHRFAELTAK